METILSDQSTNEPNKKELKKTEYAKHEDPKSIQDKNEFYKNGTNTTENDGTEHNKNGPNKIDHDEIGKNKTGRHKTEHDANSPNKTDHDETGKNKNESYKKDLNEHGPDENEPDKQDPNENDANKNEDDHLTSSLPCLVFSTPGVAKLSETAIAEHAREIAFLDDILALCPELHYTIGTLEIEGQEVLYRVQYWGDRMNVVATNPLDKRVSRRAILFALREEMTCDRENTGTPPI